MLSFVQLSEVSEVNLVTMKHVGRPTRVSRKHVSVRLTLNRCRSRSREANQSLNRRRPDLGWLRRRGDLGRWWYEVVEEDGEWLGDGGEEGEEWDGEGSGWRWDFYGVGRTLGCLLVGEGEVGWVEEVRIKMGGKRTRYHFSQDCTIKVWETSQGKLIRELKGHGHWVNSLALSTEYVLRTGAFDHTGKQYSSPEEMKKMALERYNKMKGSAPERLVSGSDDFTMFLWEPAVSKHPKTRMTGHQQLVNHVYFSPDGQWVASASFDKSVKLWNGITGKFVAAFRGHVGPVYQISWSADSRLLLSGSKDSTLKVWDIRTQKLKQDLPGHADEVFAVDWSPDGEKVASGGRDRVLKLWMVFVPFSFGTDNIYPLLGEQMALERYNKMKGSAPERLVSGSDDFTMFLWEPAVSKHPKTRMTGHQQLVNHVYFSPDGQWVASASFDKSVKLWNGITGKFVAAFRGHVGPVYQISWSADSRLLLSGSKDSTLKVWDIRTQKLKQDLPGHADEVFAVDWSPDGEKVASGGRDRVLKLWMG
ncbi:WD-40 repeat family protein [Actinidia rufa]|uniref:WD-40 repeat family protein n=1 Tax=Actinidia rufa TaxID=165716 RepID=A0A7J0HEU4_9ERIC|nr:WD-40 repeat family protein [Actinidia rufa]